jgi:hypothetical protein
VSELLFNFNTDQFYISASAHALGPLQRTLEQLADDGLLASEVESLREVGYRCNRSAEPGVGLIDLASDVFRQLVQDGAPPNALVVHHSYAVNTSEAAAGGSRELLARANYFPASLLRRFELDDMPYTGSYSSGCTGFMSLIMLAGAILRAESVEKVLCLTADLKPPDTTFDSARERLLTSDAASGFIIGREPAGYQIIGVGQYSSSRKLIPLVEVVKRAVQMTRQLCSMINTPWNESDMLCHYPNMFVQAWQMVSHFLKVTKDNQIFDSMAERAHCLSSDAIIPLEKFQGTRPGRVHAVYSFGSGLHLAVAVLREI